MNKPFFFVAAVSILLFTYLTLNSTIHWLNSQPSAPEEKFVVADTYNDRCDVVRYTPTNASRYTYFLDCKK